MRQWLCLVATGLLITGLSMANVKNANGQNRAPAAEDPFAQDPFGGDGGAAANPFGGGGAAAADPFAPSNQNAKAKPAAAKNANVNENTKSAPNVVARSDSEQRIRASLNGETAATFVNTPLVEAIARMSEDHDIPIVVDRRALEEIGLTPDLPVNLDLKNVTLRSFLRLMLREADLTYIIKDEVLQITTIEAAEQNLVTEAYVMPKLLEPKADQVIKALTASVDPSTWEALGGPSSVVPVGHVLMVSTTDDNHAEVVKFMEKLQAAYEKHLSSRN